MARAAEQRRGGLRRQQHGQRRRGSGGRQALAKPKFVPGELSEKHKEFLSSHPILCTFCNSRLTEGYEHHTSGAIGHVTADCPAKHGNWPIVCETCCLDHETKFCPLTRYNNQQRFIAQGRELKYPIVEKQQVLEKQRARRDKFQVSLLEKAQKLKAEKEQKRLAQAAIPRDTDSDDE